MKRRLKQALIRYAIVGIGAIAVDYIAYQTLIIDNILGNSNAKRVSFVLGGIWSYFLNKKFTFGIKKTNKKMPILFIAVYLIGFVLNSFSHDMLQNEFGLNWFSFSVATAVSVIWNFLGQKYLVFRHTDA